MEKPTIGTLITDQQLRAWAREHDLLIGTRGRVPQRIVAAFWRWALTPDVEPTP